MTTHVTVQDIQDNRDRIDEIKDTRIANEATLEYYHNVLFWISNGDIIDSEIRRAAAAAIRAIDR